MKSSADRENDFLLYRQTIKGLISSVTVVKIVHLAHHQHLLMEMCMF